MANVLTQGNVLARRNKLAREMTHRNSLSAGGGVSEPVERANIVPPWYQTLSGERAGQGFTEALQMMADQRGDIQIGDTSINPLDFINPMAGATVWHGSPHKFDRFDMSKIGTGEGAQAYGHGLYFADNPRVAEGYQYVHGGMPMPEAFRYKGIDVEGLAGVGAALRSGGAADPGMASGLRRFPNAGTDSSIANFGLGATPAKLKNALPEFDEDQILAVQALISSSGDKQMAMARLEAKGRPRAAGIVEETADDFQITRMAEAPGTLYKVDLPDDQIANMLDWDAPLSQQPEAVQKLFIRGDTGKFDPRWEGMTGAQIYQRSAVEFGGGPQYSEFLRSQGIPGLRYLDQGSRAAGEGTRNYVVFSDEIPKILERR